MRKMVLIMLVLAMVSSMVFAAGGRQRADDGNIRIALLIRNLEETFLMSYADNIRRLAAERGVELSVQDGRRDAATQITQLEMLLNQGFRHFVIIPNDSALSDQMNRMIHERGGAAAYSNIQPTASSLRIGPHFFLASSPELVAGRIQADLIANFFDRNPDRAPGRVLNMIVINGEMGHPAQRYRRAGLLEGLRARGYTVNIVAEGSSPHWSSDHALELMNAYIAAFRGQFNVVAAQNDAMALGAAQALIQNGMVTADAAIGTRLAVPVLGIDATADAIASMRRNELYATVLQDAVGQATVAFDLMYQVARGTFRPGNPAGGISPATAIIDEAPANDPAIIGQCYLVPFTAVDRNSDFFRNHP